MLMSRSYARNRSWASATCAMAKECLGIARQHLQVKATTNERLRFVGTSEGIAAIATASIIQTT